MKNLEIKNNDCHAALAMTKSVQNGRSLLPICKADAPLFLSDVYNKRYMSEKITSRCPQSGRSMIEMLGVLAIIGVLSVGGIAGYSKAMMKYRVNKTIEQITLIAGNIRTFFAPQGNYDGVKCTCLGSGCSGVKDFDGCPIIKKAKIIPDEMLTVNSDNGQLTAITSEFNEPVELFQDSSKVFYLNFMNIPDTACIEIITQDWSASNIRTIEVDNRDSPESEKLFTYNSLVNIEQATEACSNSDKNNIALYFE